MVRSGPGIVMTGRSSELASLQRQDEGVDTLHDAIVGYLGDLSKRHLTTEQTEQLHDYMSVAGYFESIGDTLETNLVGAGQERIRHNLRVSAKTQAVIGELADKVHWAVEVAARALREDSPRIALEVIEAKSEINGIVDAAERHLARRLIEDAPQRLATYRMESELIENLKRVYYFAKRIAKAVVIEDVRVREAPAVA